MPLTRKANRPIGSRDGTEYDVEENEGIYSDASHPNEKMLSDIYVSPEWVRRNKALPHLPTGEDEELGGGRTKRRRVKRRHTKRGGRKTKRSGSKRSGSKRSGLKRRGSKRGRKTKRS